MATLAYGRGAPLAHPKKLGMRDTLVITVPMPNAGLAQRPSHCRQWRCHFPVQPLAHRRIAIAANVEGLAGDFQRFGGPFEFGFEILLLADQLPQLLVAGDRLTHHA